VLGPAAADAGPQLDDAVGVVGQRERGGRRGGAHTRLDRHLREGGDKYIYTHTHTYIYIYIYIYNVYVYI